MPRQYRSVGGGAAGRKQPHHFIDVLAQTVIGEQPPGVIVGGDKPSRPAIWQHNRLHRPVLPKCLVDGWRILKELLAKLGQINLANFAHKLSSLLRDARLQADKTGLPSQ